MSGLNYGAAARRLLQQAEQQQKIRQLGGDRRIYLKPGTEVTLTFLDGALVGEGAERGFFKNPNRLEHQVFSAPRTPPNHYACTQEKAPCPICAEGDRPSVVTFFTVIDHTRFKGKRATYQHEKKLYPAVNKVCERLRRLAMKNGGTLRGLTVTVSRSSDQQSPRVGDGFDVEAKLTDSELIKSVKTIWKPAKTSKPIPYDEVLRYITAKRLKRLGVGKQVQQFSFQNQRGGTPNKPKRNNKLSRYI